MKANNRESQRRIAYEAARILTELRSGDYNYACQKAADRLGLGNRRLMPNRDEIESALREQQRLFRGEDQATALRRLRRLAMEAMGALTRFKPLLVGPVLDGTADQNSPIRLHLSADTSEEVIFALSDLHIPWDESQWRMKFGDGSKQTIPGFRFQADGTTIELVVLPTKGHFSKPLDPIDNRTTQGATLSQLKQLDSRASPV